MSSRKRRNTRKIAMLVRMDATRARMPTGYFLSMLGADKAMRYWETCMVPLGGALNRRGLRVRAITALEQAREKRISTGGGP